MIRISFINWWNNGENDFFHLFIKKIYKNVIITNTNPDIIFCSVFGSKENAKNIILSNKNAVSIFFSGECKTYAFYDYFLEFCDIVLGFKHINNEKYLRFPLWLTYINFDDTNYGKSSLNITKFINRGEHNKNKFCCILNNHDENNTRYPIFHSLNEYKTVDSGGNWKNNITYKIENGEQHKQKWLENYKFNICCEREIDDGYITEKIFECLAAKCIPIYLVNNIETLIECDILNQECILKFTNNNISEAIDKIKLLDTDDAKYSEFLNKPIFTENAINNINNTYQTLEKMIINKNKLHIFVCHYTKLVDRKKHIDLQLSKLQNVVVHFIDDYDKEQINSDIHNQYFLDSKEEWDNRWKFYVDYKNDKHMRTLKDSEKSLFLKHYTSLKKIIELNIDYGLVIEDDAVFSNDFTNNLKEIINTLPNDWDVYYPNSTKNMYGRKNAEYNKYVSKRNHPSGAITISYLMHKSCCEKIIQEIEKNKGVLPIDFEYNWLFYKLNLNIYHNNSKPLVTCGNFMSTIQKIE